MVGNVDRNAAKYIATSRAQRSRQEYITDFGNMAKVSGSYSRIVVDVVLAQESRCPTHCSYEHHGSSLANRKSSPRTLATARLRRARPALLLCRAGLSCIAVREIFERVAESLIIWVDGVSEPQFPHIKEQGTCRATSRHVMRPRSQRLAD